LGVQAALTGSVRARWSRQCRFSTIFTPLTGSVSSEMAIDPDQLFSGDTYDDALIE
jgi:hypothetical protein